MKHIHLLLSSRAIPTSGMSSAVNHPLESGRVAALWDVQLRCSFFFLFLLPECLSRCKLSDDSLSPFELSGSEHLCVSFLYKVPAARPPNCLCVTLLFVWRIESACVLFVPTFSVSSSSKMSFQSEKPLTGRPYVSYRSMCVSACIDESRKGGGDKK